MLIIEIKQLDESIELLWITSVARTNNSITLYNCDDIIAEYKVGDCGVTQAGLDSLWKILKTDSFSKGVWTLEQLKIVVRRT